MKKLLLALLMGTVLIACEEAASEEPKEEPKQEPTQEVKEKTEKEELQKDLVAQEEYSTNMSGYLDTYAEDSNTMSALLIGASENPDLFFDSNWKNQINGTLDSMDASLDKIESEQPPEHLQPIHDHFLLFVEDARFVTAELPGAVDTLDIDMMNQITDKVTESTGHMDDATKLIQEETGQ